MHSTKASEEMMQATHDPYHGITLPEPPQGYRLAKWGENLPHDSRWADPWAKRWVGFSAFDRPWEVDRPECSIFAIPLDQPSLFKSWQFREVPWVVPEPKTLADCVAGVPVVVKTDGGMWVVKQRKGERGYSCGEGQDGNAVYTRTPSELKLVRYLDPPPKKPMRLDDVPDGRVIEVKVVLSQPDNPTWWAMFTVKDVRFAGYPTWGVIPFSRLNRDERNDYENAMRNEFRVTNYIAEFRGPA